MCNINIYQDVRVDPTHTLTIRNQFARKMRKRFVSLSRAIKKKIVDEKFFDDILQTYSVSQDRLNSFLEWLYGQEDFYIYSQEQLGEGFYSEWTDLYIQTAYQRGIERARNELIKAGLSIPSLILTGGIWAAFNQPFHIDRVGLLYTRTFNGLKGITENMNSQISTVLAKGIADGKNPRVLARELNKVITGIGEDLSLIDTLGRFIPAQRRAELLARTEIIRAHHQAMIMEYKNWGLENIEVLAEFTTAGDNRVCPICAELDGEVFTLDEIMNKIPVHPMCFIDRQIPIYTSKGWKQIGDIKVGDLVLTHKNRFRKVTQLIFTPKQQVNVVKFKYGTKYLTMTEDHPVYVFDPQVKSMVWKKAKDCTTNDKLVIMANECPRCGKLIPFYRKYCSHSCLSKDITDRQWSNPIHRENISRKNRESMLEQYRTGKREGKSITKNAHKKMKELGKLGLHPFQREDVKKKSQEKNNTTEHRKASSERMKKNNPMHDPTIAKKARENMIKFYRQNPERRLNAIMAGYRKSKKRTSIEKIMENLLIKMGVNYVFQYPILNFDVDFAIPDLKIAIECDGVYWHKNREKELVRDRKIQNEGWTIIHFTDIQLNKELDKVEDELYRILFNHTHQYKSMLISIEKIEYRSLKKKRTLYNFSVEEDESYIAKGIVVHNCRCIALPYYPEDSHL